MYYSFIQCARIIINLVLLSFFISCGKDGLPPLEDKLTSEFFIDSKEKNKTYRIWVQLPRGYSETQEKYSTIYVLDPDDPSLDGNTNFFYIAKKSEELAVANGKSRSIIIGIRHGDYREVDYTPTKYSTTGFSGEGGGELFLNFIKKELIPKVQKDYRTIDKREARTIIGHSLGGLCGTFAFTNHNEAFGNYLLLSPSLIYDEEILLQYEQKNRKEIKSSNNIIFFGVGGTEPNMLPPIDLFYKRINLYYSNSLATLYINQGKGHNSSKDENITKALEFYFKNKPQ